MNVNKDGAGGVLNSTTNDPSSSLREHERAYGKTRKDAQDNSDLHLCSSRNAAVPDYMKALTKSQ